MCSLAGISMKLQNLLNPNSKKLKIPHKSIEKIMVMSTLDGKLTERNNNVKSGH
jgi:hypothetical protein